MDGENREYYKYWFRPNDDINEMIPIIIRRNQPEFDLIDKINYPPEDSNKPINEVELLRDKEIKIKRILKRLYQKKLPNN